MSLERIVVAATNSPQLLAFDGRSGIINYPCATPLDPSAVTDSDIVIHYDDAIQHYSATRAAPQANVAPASKRAKIVD